MTLVQGLKQENKTSLSSFLNWLLDGMIGAIDGRNVIVVDDIITVLVEDVVLNTGLSVTLGTIDTKGDNNLILFILFFYLIYLKFL